ncbi:hypothetical protein [Nocardia macrotermitis]|uniref:Uncharacterized protein n=1 Tax=Nocardia macrotermitis TaxID=2585198 RepID=A0A7K0D8S7_9NOCA|nr:hypothetical protein [Nocardia macrotermitis]MQY21999.1 hypothetical protein [Nocardia macrotermitis]
MTDRSAGNLVADDVRSPNTDGRHNRICVIYHYFEADREYRENLSHFLTFGIVPEVDYVVVLSGSCSLRLPELPNIRYVTAPNHNRDYGGHSVALHRAVTIEQYTHFIFVNSSVRGPYLPAYSDKPWYEAFLGLLDEEVGLVGATINILSPDSPHSKVFQLRHGGTPPFTHVQSMIYAMPRAVLVQLLAAGMFDPNQGSLSHMENVVDYEIRMSQLVIGSGLNIRSLLPEYNTIDYRLPHTEINPTSREGDPCYADQFFGRTLHPYETIFIKTNRDMYPPEFFAALSRSMQLARNTRSAAIR